MMSANAVIRRPRANTIADTQPSRTMDKANTSRDCCSSGSFVTKLYKMVDSEPTTIVSWIRGGTAFCIVDPKMMAEHCLPKYFRHRRFSSLIRQLNFYSFYRVQEGQLTIYQHSFFRKGRPDLLVHIKRRGAGKAKDPWFDPLVSSKPPVPSPVGIAHHVGSFRESCPPTHPELPSVRTSGMMCYSPMSKPLSSSIDNMSPALKPGMAHLSPPLVDLGGSALSDEKFVENHRWENQLLDFHDQKADYGSLMVKSEHSFVGDLSIGHSTSNLMKPSGPSSTNSLDIDIQDFLTDDCSINAALSEKVVEERSVSFLGNGVIPAKRALMARDCLKWESKNESNGYRGREEQGDGDEDAAFEQELLLDLANVEPGAWEVPLSPLNDGEDVMPWLDLCF